MPDLLLSIMTAPNAVLFSDGEATSYSLTEMYFTVDIIETLEPNLYQLSLQLCQSLGKEPQIPIKHYYSYQESSATNLKFTTATNSLARIFVIPKADSFTTAATSTQNLGTSSYFISTPRSITAWHFRVGSRQVPQYIVNDTTGLLTFEYTKKGMGRNNDVVGGFSGTALEPMNQRLWSNLAYTSVAGTNATSIYPPAQTAGGIVKWLNSTWCIILNLDHLGMTTSEEMLSGENTLQTSNSNYFVATGLSGSSTVLLFTEANAVLTLTSNGQVLITP